MRDWPIFDALGSTTVDGNSIRDWSIYVTEGRRMSLGVKDRQAGNVHTPLSISETCAARYLVVWDDELVSRGTFERRQLVQDPAVALAQVRRAAYADPDAAQVLGPARMPEVPLYDDGAARAARGETTWFVERLDEIRRRAEPPGFETWSGSLGAGEASSRLVTSAGLDVAGKGTSIDWHVTLDGEAGDGYSARAPEPETAFVDRLERLCRTARLLRGSAPEMVGGTHQVILHPDVVADYALSTLLHSLDGSTVDHGEGRFPRELFGSDEPAFREDLSLVIDPLQPLKSGSYRFTVEGVPAARTVLIERGRLVRPVLDLKYARRLGMPATSIPSSIESLILDGPPALELDAALAEASGGALVLSVLGVHTQDSTSGDFSLSAPQTLAIGAGEFSGRLRATIAGNLFDLLSSEDLRLVRFPGETTPGLLVRCRLDPK